MSEDRVHEIQILLPTDQLQADVTAYDSNGNPVVPPSRIVIIPYHGPKRVKTKEWLWVLTQTVQGTLAKFAASVNKRTGRISLHSQDSDEENELVNSDDSDLSEEYYEE